MILSLNIIVPDPGIKRDVACYYRQNELGVVLNMIRLEFLERSNLGIFFSLQRATEAGLIKDRDPQTDWLSSNELLFVRETLPRIPRHRL